MSANRNPSWKDSIEKARKMASKKFRDKNKDAWDKYKLHDWHWKKGLSIKNIANKVGMSPQSISQHFEKLGIKVRKGTGTRTVPLHIVKEDLEKMYLEDRMSMARISEHYICSAHTVNDYLIKYGIPIRTPSEYNYRKRKYTASLSINVNKKLNNTCQLCGWNKTICDVHHIIRKADGGTDDKVILVCPNCHRLIHKGLIQDEDIVRAIQ